MNCLYYFPGQFLSIFKLKSCRNIYIFLIRGRSPLTGNNAASIYGSFSRKPIFSGMIAKINIHFASLHKINNFIIR